MYRTLEDWRRDHEAHFEAGKKFHEHVERCSGCHHQGGGSWMLCRTGLTLYRAADALVTKA